MSIRDDVIAQARARLGVPYRLDPPPDGVNNLDCSLFVLKVYEAAGLSFPFGTRTAEQIRASMLPVGFADVRAGDCLFFEHTYEPSERSAIGDGHVASHIGISLGAGTRRMLNALEPVSAETNIGTPYWQGHLLEARRFPGIDAVADTGDDPDGLTDEPDHLFTFEQLWPTIHAAGLEFGYDAQALAGIVKQESGFRNWRVHRDLTGHGLLGLDDNGLLSDFERWSGLSIGRGQAAASIPIVPQIRYAARALADYANRLGGTYAAARAWHRGERLMNDARGQQYEQLIRAQVAELFAEGEPTVADTIQPETQSAPSPADDPNAWIVAVADLADRVAAIEDRDARLTEARRIREQFVGPRPAA